MNAMYLIGNIANTHGIKGEVKIYNLSDFNRFLVSEKIYVQIKGVKKYFIIERVRPQGNLFIVKFKGIDNINDVLAYKGMDVFSDEDVSEQLEEDDYHYTSLLDKDVYSEEGTLLGKVISLVPVPQGHLIEIEKTDGTKALVPFVKAFVKEVTKDRIIILPIEGLL
jgi:16S rRNA processing protein RimM